MKRALQFLSMSLILGTSACGVVPTPGLGLSSADVGGDLGNPLEFRVLNLLMKIYTSLSLSDLDIEEDLEARSASISYDGLPDAWTIDVGVDLCANARTFHQIVDCVRYRLSAAGLRPPADSEWTVETLRLGESTTTVFRSWTNGFWIKIIVFVEGADFSGARVNVGGDKGRGVPLSGQGAAPVGGSTILYPGAEVTETPVVLAISSDYSPVNFTVQLSNF